MLLSVVTGQLLVTLNVFFDVVANGADPPKALAPATVEPEGPLES